MADGRRPRSGRAKGKPVCALKCPEPRDAAPSLINRLHYGEFPGSGGLSKWRPLKSQGCLLVLRLEELLWTAE
ncbi:hypothetical protein NDU88_001574 [Pleurodeles waltl]|uniref:Uncharacterized protein n=1 Tax=Pleurodeles waltl TaxID=8319 RepID=A0AAV7MLX4_PLEWA|nr:hypothetical protein NDU88_001574 [Pleurodeles waltl]